jgi:hypothetical protein
LVSAQNSGPILPAKPIPFRGIELDRMIPTGAAFSLHVLTNGRVEKVSSGLAAQDLIALDP